MKLPVFLTLLTESESTLAQSLREVAHGHGAEPDVYFLCMSLADQCGKPQAWPSSWFITSSALSPVPR